MTRAPALPAPQTRDTCAGLLSLHFLTQPLHGSPSQHQRQPAHACFVGDVSAQSHPILFVACVKALVQHLYAREDADAEARQSSVPIVVNTAGWIKVRRWPSCAAADCNV